MSKVKYINITLVDDTEIGATVEMVADDGKVKVWTVEKPVVSSIYDAIAEGLKRSGELQWLEK